MEQDLIKAMSKLTDAIIELNKSISKPLDLHSEVYNITVELKHGLEDLKISVDNLNKTMLEE